MTLGTSCPVAGEEPIAANVATPAATNNNEQNRRRNGDGVKRVRVRDHGAHNFVLSESNRAIAGTLDFNGCCFISSFKNFARRLQKFRKSFTDGNSMAFVGKRR